MGKGVRLVDLFTDARLAKLDAVEPVELSPTPELQERFLSITSQPNIVDTICAYLASGGTLVTLAECWNVRYGDLTNWMRNDEIQKQNVSAMR